MDRRRIWLAILGVVLLITPLLFYFLNFAGQSVSVDTETWGHFGDYLNGTFMPIIALVGVLVTLSLGVISENRSATNVRIEQQKQRPLLHIGYFDGSQKIKIFMKNKGNGPLLIKRYRLVGIDNKEIDGIYNSLPGIHRKYNNYTGNLDNIVLSPGEIMNLLLYVPIVDNEAGFEASRQKIRQAISTYRITVEYHDVYDVMMPTYERSLAWFSRPETI